MITLGIIGVVAAMTLPTLIQNHQKQTYVTALKKAYSNIQNAFAQMAADEDVVELSQTFCSTAIYYNGTPEYEECFNRLKKYFNVVKSEYASGSGGSFYTNDGMYYALREWSIYVDVNGDKGPNKWGRDKFVFHLLDREYKLNNKIEPWGAYWGDVNYQTYCTPEKLKQSEGNGIYCTAKVLIEGKMDY